ncbi:hypothetical protein KEJ39_00255 [Candidatus Bathyarchaeota archaeon]|nr:hypothetical protein [Candidatus Bathyarchaeota archaeon]
MQNLNRTRWTEKEVYSRLESIMLKAFSDVCEVSANTGMSMRNAAYALSLERLADAPMKLGLFPQLHLLTLPPSKTSKPDCFPLIRNIYKKSSIFVEIST